MLQAFNSRAGKLVRLSKLWLSQETGIAMACGWTCHLFADLTWPTHVMTNREQE
jgi:hypothetical protein